MACACMVLLSTCLGAAGCAYLNYNLREVEDGGLYRAGQMPPDHLETTLHRHGIRTVVNLRGENPGETWYDGETAVCARLGVDHHSLRWSMNHLPEPESLQRLIDIYRNADGPVLVHCQGGTHRSGVAAAVYRLVQGAAAGQAREELGPFFGDAPIGQLLVLYEGSPLPFEDWAHTEYPALYRARPG